MNTPPHQARRVCRRCHRPEVVCLCRHFRGIAPVVNRTGVIILQHPRERFHPLGTARIALRGLRNVRLEPAAVDASRSLRRKLTLPPETGLLYPHPGAQILKQGSPSAPQNLLVLDGTWHTAQKLYQANPWLQELPHYQLQPDAPGRYRIRKEPDAQCLSTIEAIVCSLRLLEPETAGLEQLLAVFEGMIDTQVGYVRSRAAGPRHRKRRPRLRPPSLLHSARERLVIAYAELIPKQGGGLQPLYWVAQRLATSETFARFLLACSPPPAPGQLAHMQLAQADLDQGVALEPFCEEWSQFLGPRAVVAAWNQGVLDQALRLTHQPCQTLLLKAAYCNLAHRACGSLEQVVAKEGLTPPLTPFCGRAGQRLGQALAVLLHLTAAPCAPQQQDSGRALG